MSSLQHPMRLQENPSHCQSHRRLCWCYCIVTRIQSHSPCRASYIALDCGFSSGQAVCGCRDLYARAVRWSADESEAFAPFLALWKVRLKICLVAAMGLAAAVAKAPGLNTIVLLSWDLIWKVHMRLSGPIVEWHRLAGRAAGLALQWETSMLTLLCCCLATVLWWRRRRRNQSPSAAPDD